MGEKVRFLEAGQGCTKTMAKVLGSDGQKSARKTEGGQTIMVR